MGIPSSLLTTMMPPSDVPEIQPQNTASSTDLQAGKAMPHALVPHGVGGDSLLLTAVQAGERGVVESLIDKAHDDERWSLFRAAVDNVDEPMLNLLERHLGPLDTVSLPVDVGSYLHVLAASQRAKSSLLEEVVYSMVARVHQPGVETLRNGEGMTPLMLAVRASNTDVVDVLLNGPVDLESHRTLTGDSLLDHVQGEQPFVLAMKNAQTTRILTSYPSFLDRLALLESVAVVRGWVAKMGVDPQEHMPQWHRHNEALLLNEAAHGVTCGDGVRGPRL